MNSESSNWYLLRSEPAEAALNMALDAALLESIAAIGGPVLRLYSWTERAASFGYFQKYSEIESMTHLRPLVRRQTGGGLVPHDADWTYSFVVPPSHDWYSLKAVASYRRMHEWIRDAFSRLNIQTELAAESKRALPGQCFAGHEKFDVLWNGCKIAGAAQRRTRAGLLIQGSVQPPPLKLNRADWGSALRDAAQSSFRISWKEFAPSAGLVERAAELAENTFSQRSYNQRR